MGAALYEVRIIEIGNNVSAPYCCKLLADLGADVIKVEQSGTGDPLRNTGIFPAETRDPTKGALFHYLNTNKRSVEADLNGRNNLDAVLRLIAAADIVIENLGHGVLEKLGLAFTELRYVNPHIALVRISDFGQDGPYADIPATDFTVQAASGWVSNHGAVGHDPVQVGGRASDYTCGVHAACAALTAYRTTRQLGVAVSVDVSKQECLLSTLPQPALRYKVLESIGLAVMEERVFPIPGIVHCKDGLVGINVLTAQHHEDCCSLLEVPQYIPKQQEIMLPGHELDSFYRDIRPWLMAHEAEEILDLCQAFRIPACPVSDGKKLPELSQLKARSFYTEDTNGDFIQPSFPYRLGATPARLRGRAPRIGEEDIGNAGQLWGDTRRRGNSDSDKGNPEKHLPFKGLRVLDVGIFWAGPYASCYLGAMGADVIKVESVQRPDAFRYQAVYSQESDDWYEQGYLWQGTNLNKRDLTLNLNAVEGRDILEHLIEKADVIIENFSPRVMENFGFGYDHLSKLNSTLIVVRMPGFGLEGPWQNYVGWAMSIEQASGLAWVTGTPDGMPLNPGGFADPMIAMHALVAIQSALHHRERTGEGQIIEVAQLEAAACLTAEQVIGYSMTGNTQGRIGNRSETMAPQGLYKCADGDWVSISIRDDTEWQKFMAVMDSPKWGMDDRFSGLKGRQDNHDELDQYISEWTANLKSDVVVESVRHAAIPVAKVLVPQEMSNDPHLEERSFHEEVEHPISGARRYAGWPMRQFPGPKSHHRYGAPTLGQHNSTILRDELGMTDAQVEELEKIGIIGHAPKGIG